MKGIPAFAAFAAVALTATASPAVSRGPEPAFFWHEREKYVAIRTLAGFYGMEITGFADRRLTVRNQQHTLVFKTESREMLVNGTLVWLHAPMGQVRRRWAIRENDARMVVDPLIRPLRHLRGVGYRVVVLDPGHGGQDTGARGRHGLEEKRVVLDIARRVRAHLVNGGVRVHLTRDGDRFVELGERIRIAESRRADLFVSIHLNSASNPDASGIETYSLASVGYESTAGGLSHLAQPGNRYEAANGIAAYRIHRALLGSVGGQDRGVRRSRFFVLRNAPCPAVLVECGFISNPAEESRLFTESYRERVAAGIAAGIVDYLALARRAQGETP